MEKTAKIKLILEILEKGGRKIKSIKDELGKDYFYSLNKDDSAIIKIYEGGKEVGSISIDAYGDFYIHSIDENETSPDDPNFLGGKITSYLIRVTNEAVMIINSEYRTKFI